MAFTVRWLLLTLPVAMVAVVTLALVTGGSARPYRVARVWGGPTDVRRISLRVEAVELIVERAAVQEAPIARDSVLVELHAPDFDARRRVTLDAEGSADLAFELPRVFPKLEVMVSQGSELARGPLTLGAERWAKAARRRGGWSTLRAGAFALRVAPRRGALAVPFPGELLLAVERDGHAAAGVRLHVTGSGSRVAPELSTTDAEGHARLAVTPLEHSASLTLELADDHEEARISFGIPVVPGALEVRRENGSLVIESPVPREVAYYAFVTDHERLLGGRAPLVASPEGGAKALVPFPELAPPPQYVVVSSERDLRSPAAVGWPLAAGTDWTAPTTFDAVDALLVDGRPRAALHEAQRAARVRWVVGAFCAATLALELALLVIFTRRSDRSLDVHLEDAGIAPDEAERLAPRRSPRVVIALIAIALGFFVVAAIGVVMAR